MRIKIALIFIALTIGGIKASFAQYYSLGRSPESIRWNQVKRDGGKVIFPDYYQPKALMLSSFMDSVAPAVRYGLSYAPIKISTILHTQNFLANGLVIWAPKRMELEMIPNISTYAEPWYKQLAVHESRHAVQYGNLNRGWIKPLSYVFGQQASIASIMLVPMWFLEGDAVMVETQMSPFGRALQPSFTLEYRAYFSQGEGYKRFRTDTWFSGSYKYYIPDHYQLGYQLTAWSREKYGDEIWDKVMRFAVRNPYMILTTKFGLRKYYKTSATKIFKNTFADLQAFWAKEALRSNSSSIINTPTTSYTTYLYPIQINDTVAIALKKDLDRTSRFVEVNSRTAAERTLFYTGDITSGVSMRDSIIYWSEYRSSALWEQQVFSKVAAHDLKTGRTWTIKDRVNSLYPYKLSDGRLATIDYKYEGYYILNLGDEVKHKIADTISVHGMCYDQQTNTIAIIALSDEGMYLAKIDPTSGELTKITKPSRVTLSNLTGSNGVLTFSSIGSGRDEVHMYDLTANQEFRLTDSQYGSNSPAAPTSDRKELLFTTYTVDGYRLAKQSIQEPFLTKVNYSYLPDNVINPPRRRWNVMNIDTINYHPSVAQFAEQSTKVRRYRKLPNAVNIHSWLPLSFNPFKVVDENNLRMNFGATVMSQNLLSSTSGYVGYGFTSDGGLVHGLINYDGLAPKIEVSFNYGGGDQLVYGLGNTTSNLPKNPKRYFHIKSRIYLPLTLRSDLWNTQLTPSVEFSHTNSLIYNATSKKYKHGLQQLKYSLSYQGYMKRAKRDILPRWGYGVKATAVSAPANNTFSTLWALFGRIYTPGILAHNSLSVSGAFQKQNPARMYFSYKEAFPRGADYNFSTKQYSAVSVDYQLPVWYPDGGIPSIVYFSRLRLNMFYDQAWYKYASSGKHGELSSYGAEIFLDMRIARIPVKEATLGLSICQPSDQKSPVFGMSFSLPL